MRNYVNAGDNVTTLATEAVKSGDFVMINNGFGFAQTDADEGEEFALVRKGVFRVDVVTAAADVDQFVPIFWDEATSTFSDTDGVLVGMSAGRIYVATAGVAEVDLVLNTDASATAA